MAMSSSLICVEPPRVRPEQDLTLFRRRAEAWLQVYAHVSLAKSWINGLIADWHKVITAYYNTCCNDTGGDTPQEAVESVLEHFIEEEKRHEYYQFFKELADIYDVLSPDAFLRPYIEDVETLARMYSMLKEAYEPGIAVDRDFSKKTAELVQKHTATGKIKPSLEVYEINENTLKVIEEEKVSDREKVFNLLKSIERVVVDYADKSLYLVSIGEKTELIARLYKERQRTTQETLEELKRIVEEINSARREQAGRNMPPEVFSIYWLFKNEAIDSPEDKANQMRRVLEQYPHWRTSEAHEREIRQRLYRVLLQSGIKDTRRVTELANNVMRVIRGRLG